MDGRRELLLSEKMGNMITEIMKQAHEYGADDTGDPTTVNSNEKEVKDPALEPEVADGESIDCKQYGKRFNQKAGLEKHMSSMHEADISFECTKCGAYNKDKIVTNGHIKSSIRCQTCRTDLTNEDKFIPHIVNLHLTILDTTKIVNLH